MSTSKVENGSRNQTEVSDKSMSEFRRSRSTPRGKFLVIPWVRNINYENIFVVIFSFVFVFSYFCYSLYINYNAQNSDWNEVPFGCWFVGSLNGFEIFSMFIHITRVTNFCSLPNGKSLDSYWKIWNFASIESWSCATKLWS